MIGQDAEDAVVLRRPGRQGVLRAWVLATLLAGMAGGWPGLVDGVAGLVEAGQAERVVDA